MCVTIAVDYDGKVHVSSLHPKNDLVYRSLPLFIDIEGGYTEDETEEEKLETISGYEDYIRERFDEWKEWAEDIQIAYI